MSFIFFVANHKEPAKSLHMDSINVLTSFLFNNNPNNFSLLLLNNKLNYLKTIDIHSYRDTKEEFKFNLENQVLNN